MREVARAPRWCPVSRVVDAGLYLLLGWSLPLAGAFRDGWVSWKTFGIGVASVVFWSTIVGGALCQATGAGVIGS